MKYRARRIVSDTLVQVRHEDMAVQMRVRNATASGLKLAGILDVEADDSIEISIRNIRFPARVVWTASHAMGIAFERSLSPSEVPLFTGKRGQDAKRKPGRVGFAF